MLLWIPAIHSCIDFFYRATIDSIRGERAPSSAPASPPSFAAGDSIIYDLVPVTPSASASGSSTAGSQQAEQDTNEQATPVAKHKKRKQKAEASSELDTELVNYLRKETTEDEHYALSVAAMLKRLSDRKRALAKLRMQQILFDIEFDEPV